MTEQPICIHCGAATAPNQQFCCSGCSTAYQIINDFGLQNYYLNRPLTPEALLLKPENKPSSDLSQFVTNNEDGSKSLYLLVEGIHCAACVWLIENILKKQPAVTKARVNMSSRKLHLSWRGEENYGNSLVHLIGELGYRLTPFDFEILQSQEKKYNDDLLKALSVAGFAAGNIMLISVALWSSSSENMGIATRNLLYWVSALIALPTIIYSGRIFFASAWRAVKNRSTNMDVPISVAIILVGLVSIFDAINRAEHIYFDSAVMLIFFLLIGRYLDFSVRRKALSVTSDLLALSATTATVLENDGRSRIIATRDIKIGMILLVARGEKIPGDGVIIQGKSAIDFSIINGESLPREVKENDEVFAGTINLNEAIKIRVTKNKDQTLLAQIGRLIENFEQKKGRYVAIADRLSRYYTPLVHLLALTTFAFWFYYLRAGFAEALSNASAVLIITCPCALALAVPVVQTLAGSLLMRQGILLKSGQALEKLNEVKAIIFDKTGTLTNGSPLLIKAVLINQGQLQEIGQETEIFRLAVSLASSSNHPLSKALLNNFSGQILALDGIKEIPGFGLIGNYQNQPVKLGKKELLEVEFDDNKISDETELLVYCSYQNQIALFVFKDQLRIDAQKTISLLRQNYHVILLSGDRAQTVAGVAKELQIDEYYSGKTPLEKCQYLQEFKQKYGSILMVGDGLNDAPALAAADISMSFAKANDISKNIADIVFQSEKLAPIITSLAASKKALRLMRQNFAIALFYNLFAVPFAIAGYIVPLLAALAMSSSSILVVLNSLRMTRGKN